MQVKTSSDDKLEEFDFPALYVATDAYSLKWQKRFVFAQKFQLTLLVLAAIGGSTNWIINQDIKISALFVVLALVSTLFIRIYLLNYIPEKKWYNGRAAAESIKTLTWKYTQCASPFGKELNKIDADELFISKLNEVKAIVPTVNESVTNSVSQISDEMRELRNSTLSIRKKYYIKHRVEDQITWYNKKSEYNSKKSYLWGIIVALVEFCAIVFAVSRLLDYLDVDMAGIFTTLAAAAIAWMQSKQYETLSRSYQVTAQEIMGVNSILAMMKTENDWSNKVEQAEEVFSREHTLWVASHSFTKE